MQDLGEVAESCKKFCPYVRRVPSVFRIQLEAELGRAILTFRTQLADFFSILLNQIRFRNNTDRGGSVTASEWGIPWERTGLV